MNVDFSLFLYDNKSPPSPTELPEGSTTGSVLKVHVHWMCALILDKKRNVSIMDKAEIRILLSIGFSAC